MRTGNLRRLRCLRRLGAPTLGLLLLAVFGATSGCGSSFSTAELPPAKDGANPQQNEATATAGAPAPDSPARQANPPESAPRKPAGPPAAEPPAAQPSGATGTATRRESGTPGTSGDFRLPAEAWSVILMSGNRVGHSHFRCELVDEGGESLLKCTSTMKLTIQRFGQTVTQEMKLVSTETPAGEMRHCRCESKAGPVTEVTEGVVEGERLRLSISTAGKSNVHTLPWDPAYRSYFSEQLELYRRPLKPGESRTYKTLLPIFNQVAEIKLVAGDFEVTEVGSSKQRLLRVDSTSNIGVDKIQAVVWTDAQGNTIKSTVPNFQQVSYRTTREDALQENASPQFDVGSASVVSIARPLPKPHQSKRIVYRATLDGNSAEGVFVEGGSQQVKIISPDVVEVRVDAIRPDQPAKLAQPAKPPTESDLGSNNFIQSDAPVIVSMADEVAPGEEDAWKLACALEQHVRKSIRSKNFSQAFATAADVAVTREGDCTEHAVLLAALCRARKIPARVAIGLVYYPRAQGFAYHMWNEAWINDRWIPLDGTLGAGGIGAAHLKLVDSDLDGADAYSAFLPVFRVLGRLKLEVASIE